MLALSTIAVIPARMGSSRYPGKPLARIRGLTMIEHVYRRVALSGAVDATYVATCDAEIQRVAEGFGAPVIMTSAEHVRASDRVAEAARHLDAELVVMVQGDEPMVTPHMIDMAVQPFASDPDVVCSNLAAPIASEQELADPNCIKVVMDRRWNALYFSRQPIPSLRQQPFETIPAYKQVCIIPFGADFLQMFAYLEPTPLEQAESIDMLRALEHGYDVRLVKCEVTSQSVDTPDDLARVDRLMAEDPLLAAYAGK